MDGWNTIVSFWDGLFNLFSSVMLVLGSVDMNISKTKRHKRTRTINSKNDLRTGDETGLGEVKPVSKIPQETRESDGNWAESLRVEGNCLVESIHPGWFLGCPFRDDGHKLWMVVGQPAIG